MVDSDSESWFLTGTLYSSLNHLERSCIRHRSEQNGSDGHSSRRGLEHTEHRSNLALMARVYRTTVYSVYIKR
jgi:hypothetical protein